MATSRMFEAFDRAMASTVEQFAEAATLTMTFRGIAPGDRAQTPPYTDAEMPEADSLERLACATDGAWAMTFREECARAAGAMLEHPKEGGFFLVTATPHRATGELTLYPAEKGGEEHASLELHGLSREQTLRVLVTLRGGL